MKEHQARHLKKKSSSSQSALWSLPAAPGPTYASPILSPAYRAQTTRYCAFLLLQKLGFVYWLCAALRTFLLIKRYFGRAAAVAVGLFVLNIFSFRLLVFIWFCWCTFYLHMFLFYVYCIYYLFNNFVWFVWVLLHPELQSAIDRSDEAWKWLRFVAFGPGLQVAQVGFNVEVEWQSCSRTNASNTHGM